MWGIQLSGLEKSNGKVSVNARQRPCELLPRVSRRRERGEGENLECLALIQNSNKTLLKSRYGWCDHISSSLLVNECR